MAFPQQLYEFCSPNQIRCQPRTSLTRVLQRLNSNGWCPFRRIVPYFYDTFSGPFSSLVAAPEHKIAAPWWSAAFKEIVVHGVGTPYNYIYTFPIPWAMMCTNDLVTTHLGGV